MTDPAVEAAQRAWDKNKARSFSVQRVMAAREALAPLRELHQKTYMYFARGRDDKLMCGECGDAWPCATAKLIYPDDELDGDR